MLTRRHFLSTTALAGSALMLPAQARAQIAASGAILFRGGHVVTLDAASGDLEVADVLVRDGAIVEIGADIAPGDAEVIDASGCVVMPGFVDGHWHMWNTIARGLSTSSKGGFADTMKALSQRFTPQASALGVRLAMAEAIDAGITTVNNWAHNVRTPEHAAAELDAQRASGVRGRFSYGYPQDIAMDAVMDVADLRALQTQFGTSGLVDLGLCVRGPDRSEETVWRAEWDIARELGLPLTTHIASTAADGPKDNIATLARDGLLGPDVQLVHATHASEADFADIAQAGSPVNFSPWTELEVCYGIPPIAAAAKAGCAISLSVDNMVLAGRADMFGVMRVAADLAAGSAQTQSAVSDRVVLEWATMGGARDLGRADSIGSITVGKRADLILVRADRLGLAPNGSIDMLLTHMAQPGDVELVMIDGIIRKRDGVLVDIDTAALLDEVSEEIARIRTEAGVEA